MPAAKKTNIQSKKENQQPVVNIAEVGRKYYDVLDVYSNKVISKIIENSGQLNIDKNAVLEINKIIIEETVKAKNWGVDQLIKAVKGN